jgi:hypothetical protein
MRRFLIKAILKIVMERYPNASLYSIRQERITFVSDDNRNRISYSFALEGFDNQTNDDFNGFHVFDYQDLIVSLLFIIDAKEINQLIL